MKFTACSLFLSALLAAAVWADDLTREVQERLKDQGFFYGEVNGQPGSETSAAIRRYQIRYGLKVTGELNDETRHSLGLAGSGTSQPQISNAPAAGSRASGSARSSPQEQANSGDNRRPDSGGRQFYSDPGPPYSDGGEETYPDRRPEYGYDSRRNDGQGDLQPWASSRFYRGAGLFAGSPYEDAPDELKTNVLFAAQGELARQGFYHGSLDGVPGPSTIRAILSFQQEQGLAPSGRLDYETCGGLHVLPGQEHGPRQAGLNGPDQFLNPPSQRIYRGIWLH
jgi:peptidoglycan hydrolase-like protein with peptidoglycan-binding domain